MRVRSHERGGAALVEFAVVAPVLFSLLLGLIVGGLGIFRYQQVAWLAREGARYASVRGQRYAISTGQPAATQADVAAFVQASAIDLDASRLNTAVTWNPDNRQGGQLTVIVTYQWFPGVMLGSLTLSSTSSMLVSY